MQIVVSEGFVCFVCVHIYFIKLTFRPRSPDLIMLVITLAQCHQTFISCLYLHLYWSLIGAFMKFLSTTEIKIGKAQDVHQDFFVQEPEAATSLWIPIVS